jgi:xylulokinase
MEGVCFWFRQSLDLHNQGFKVETYNIKLTGGLSIYPVLTQLRADVLDKKIKVSDYPDLALLGAAIIAGVGVQEYKSWKEVYETIPISFKEVRPRKNRAVFYEKKYSYYIKLAGFLEKAVEDFNDFAFK